jgi:hypothetical protein
VPIAVSDSVATIIGEAVKRDKKSDTKPARTVLSYGIFPLGRAMAKTDLLALHAVTGLVDVAEICDLRQPSNACGELAKGHTSITISSLLLDFRPSSNFSTGSSFSSLSNQEVKASHQVMMTVAILGTNMELSG